MNQKDIKKRILAAEKLLSEETTTLEKVKSIHSLLHGINPKLDKVLQRSLSVASSIEKLQKGEVIELTTVSLPEKAEEQKRRKKAIIFFINTLKDLKNEVDRLKSEFENFGKENPSGKTESVFKIVYKAKGILGITTIAAALIVGFILFRNSSSPKNSAPTSNEEKSKTKVIIFNDKQIPLTQLRVGEGPECDQDEHYHALDHTIATALDGSPIPDPGECGFGKVKDVKVIEIE